MSEWQEYVLARLRAHAAANPGDVHYVSEGVRQMAELEAYRDLGELARKWRRRCAQTKRLAHEQARAAVNAALDEAIGGSVLDSRIRTIPGMPAPRLRLREEPFPLVNVKRLPPPPQSVRRVKVMGVRLSSPSKSSGTRAQARPAWDALVRAVQCALPGRTAERRNARG